MKRMACFADDGIRGKYSHPRRLRRPENLPHGGWKNLQPQARKSSNPTGREARFMQNHGFSRILAKQISENRQNQ